MNGKKILFVGMSEIREIMSVKGFNIPVSAGYYEVVGPIIHLAESLGYDCDYIPSHRIHPDYPRTLEQLAKYDVVIFGNVGADTFLLDPVMTNEGKRCSNLLRLTKSYVENGGSFVMTGGYCAFQGIHALANYKGTAIEEILPVEMLPGDDRVECPEGIDPIYERNEILGDMPVVWPYIFGYNRTRAKENAMILLQWENDPLIAAWCYGEGRTLAYTTDINKHWVNDNVLNWDYYPVLWKRLFDWLCSNSDM